MIQYAELFFLLLISQQKAVKKASQAEDIATTIKQQSKIKKHFTSNKAMS